MPLENNSLTQNNEIKKLLEWLGNPPKNPNQINQVNESDCELLLLNNSSYLATTVDSISEEISIGLYQDPYTMGWVTAQASLSDLAAVGSSPLGLLFSAQWNDKTSVEFKKNVAKGFHDALNHAGSYLFGGDSGTSTSTVLTSVGIGLCNNRPVTRLGIKPGDFLCITGKTGCGPALSFRFLRNELSEQFPENYYRPQARLIQGQKLVGIASAMIDTSDGLLSSLKQLSMINQIGLELQWNSFTLDERAIQYCEQRDIPLWLLWIGEHGDFELIAAISPDKLSLAKCLVPDLQVLGRAVKAEDEISVDLLDIKNKKRIKLDMEFTQCLNSGQNVIATDLSFKLNEIIKYIRKEGLP